MRNRATKSSLAPLILVLLGGIFLLNNFGFLPWSIWLSLWRFWPIILILIGLEFWFGRHVSLKTTIILFLLIFIAPIFLFFNPFGGNPLTTSKIEINEALSTSTRAKVVVELPAVNLKVSSLATDSAKSASGEMSYSSIAGNPEIVKTEDKGTSFLTIKQNLASNLPFLSSIRNNLDLSLSRLVPIDLTVKTGAHNATLDLKDLRVDTITVETGAGNLTIKYPGSFSNRTFIKTAASALTLEIPTEVATRIKISGGPKNLTLPQERFEQEGNTYKTRGFDSAKIRIEIEIQIGAGNVTIK